MKSRATQKVPVLPSKAIASFPRPGDGMKPVLVQGKERAVPVKIEQGDLLMLACVRKASLAEGGNTEIKALQL